MSVSSVGPAAGVCLCLCGTHWISPKHTCSHKQTHKTTTVFVLLKRTNVSSDINYTQLVKADEQWGKRDPDVPPLIPSVHKMFHLNQVILIMKDVGKLIIQLSHVHLVLHRGDAVSAPCMKKIIVTKTASKLPALSANSVTVTYILFRN